MLNDTEVTYRHKHKEHIVLEDIFVFQDLKNIKQEYDEIAKSVHSKELSEIQNLQENILILGSEQSGKTSLSKFFFKRYVEQGGFPLICNGGQISSVNIEKLLNKLIKEQYGDISFDEFKNYENKILIIDDYDKLKINIRYQRKLLENILSLFDKLIIFSDISIRYDEGNFIELSDFLQYEILPLGNLRRGELIEKWNSLGRIETIELKELHDNNDNVTRHVDSIIRKNILPPKPIYILTIIQLLDTSSSTDYTLTSYGHCYQSLIQSALKKSKIKSVDFDLYINYLTEIAFSIFETGKNSIKDIKLSEFKKDYSKKYLISSHEEVINTLLHSNILRKQNDEMFFGYRYIFYFYVAKYLADHINIQECKEIIEYLCENLHTEKNSNILIFLVHHSKDKAIIDEILRHASVVFNNYKEANLDEDDTKHLVEYITSIPKLVIEQKNIDDERKKTLKAKDEANLENDTDESSEEQPNDSDQLDILSEINRSVRIVEIIGQILRNRYGSLTKEQLTALSLSAYSSGLKFLNFFLTGTRDNQDYILKVIQENFRKNTTFSNEKISKEARNIFLMFCYGTSYNVIKKIANSLGSDKLIPIFEEIARNQPDSPAIQLIQIAICMEFKKKIPKKELSILYTKFEENKIAQRLLQELVIQHLYLNHVEYKDRQWISEKLKMPIQNQRLIQSKAEFKE